MQEWFIAGQPVSGKFFYGRQKEIKTITTGFGNNYAIVGIRRVGKTSLLLELEKEFRRKNIVPIMINVQAIIPFTIENFLKEYTRAVTYAYAYASKNKQIKEKTKKFLRGKWEGLLDYLKTIRIKAYKEMLEMWFEYDQGPKKDQTRLIKEAVAYPEKLAKESDKKIIIMLDEFQEVQKLGEEFMNALRSNIQKTASTSYIISGSAVGTMEHILGNRKSPFYGMFLLQELGPLDEKSARKLVRKVRDFGVMLSKGVEEEVIKLTGCYPLYLQAAGKIMTVRAIVIKSEVARLTGTKHDKTISKEDLRFCWANLFSELSFHFEGLEKEMNDREKQIMGTIATKDIHTPSEIARQIQLPLTSMPKYLNKLIREGFLKKTDKAYEFTDPVFKQWYRNKLKMISQLAYIRKGI